MYKGRSNPQKGFRKPGHIFRVWSKGLNFKTMIWAHLGERETDTGQQANQRARKACFIVSF